MIRDAGARNNIKKQVWAGSSVLDQQSGGPVTTTTICFVRAALHGGLNMALNIYSITLHY